MGCRTPRKGARARGTATAYTPRRNPSYPTSCRKRAGPARLRVAAVDQAEEPGEHGAGAEVADLRQQDLIVDRSEREPEQEARGAGEPRRRRPPGLMTGQGDLVERSGGEVEPHSDGDQR